jgi:hypothetical protein
MAYYNSDLPRNYELLKTPSEALWTGDEPDARPLPTQVHRTKKMDKPFSQAKVLIFNFKIVWIDSDIP